MAIQFLHDVDVNGNLNLKNNELQNAKLQQLATNPGTVVEGMIFQNTTSDVVIVGLNGSWVPLTSADGDITGVTAGDGLTGGGSTGAVTLNVVGGSGITASANEISLTDGLIADGSSITSVGALTELYVDNIFINNNQIHSLTNDMTITATAGQSVVVEGVDIDGGVVTGASSITSTAFVGNVTGNVTGNTSGTALTVTQAAQTAITSVGTLTALQVDNININGNTISSTAGTDLNITPLAGQQIVLDGTIVIDAGVVTGATSIASTNYVVGGHTVDDIDITSEFVDADAHIMSSKAIGTRFGLKAGSSSIVTTGALNSGSITSGFGTIDTGASAITTTGLISGGSLDIDNVLINGSNIGHTDDTDLITLANGQVTIAGGLTVTGTTTTNNVETVSTSSGVIFEGAAADGHDATLISAVSGADVIYTLPNVTGTIALTSDLTGTNSNTNTGDEPDASVTVKGIVELATTDEALTGTDTARAVTAAGLSARSYTATIGDGSATSIAVDHNLGTRAVIVQMFDTSSYETVYAQVVRTTTARVTVDFNTAPATNDITIMVTKVQ